LPSFVTSGPRVVDGTEVFTYDSEAVGDQLEVSVAVPPGWKGDPLPAVYTLDPRATFDVATGIVRTLRLLGAPVFPALAVVGVGPATDDVLRVMSLRFRDMTPEPPAEGDPVVSTAGALDGYGGASKLLDAIEREIAPELERRFPLAPDDRIICGWSLGGLFALHALFERPAVFRRYLAISPSIWFAGGYGLRAEETFAAAHDDLAAEVFFTVGELEETSGNRVWPPLPSPELGAMMADARLVSNVHALVDRLRSRRYQSLSVDAIALPGEHHSSTFPSAFNRGMLHFFAPGS
jgi:uncharacterized protein